MFAQVCLNLLPYNKEGYYTYQVPENLLGKIIPGSLVLVPFGNRILSGVVLKLVSTSSYKAKEILRLLRSFPVMTNKQIQLLEWLGQYYYCPLSLVLKYFLQALPFKTVDLDYPQTSSQDQELILIPTPLDIKFSETAYHHNLPLKIKRQIWLEVHTGQRGKIIGTRSSLYLPYTNLRSLTVHQAESQHYLERRAPYLHAAQIAQRLAELFKAKLKIEYSPHFYRELKERETLHYPPFSELVLLRPSKPSNKCFKQASQLLLGLKQATENQGLNIEIFKSISKNNLPEIFLKGERIRAILNDIPKGWRVVIYYLNIN